MYDRTDISNLYYIPDAGNHTHVFDGVYTYEAIPDNELEQALLGFARMNGLDGLGELDGWFRRIRKKIKRGFRRIGRKTKRGFKRFGRKFKKVAKKVGKGIYKVARKAIPIAAVVANVIPGIGQGVSLALTAASIGIEAIEARRKRKKAEREAKRKAAQIRKKAMANLNKEVKKQIKAKRRIVKRKPIVVMPTPKVIQRKPTVKPISRAIPVKNNVFMPQAMQPIQAPMTNQAMYPAMQMPLPTMYPAMEQNKQLNRQKNIDKFIKNKVQTNNTISDISALTRLTMQSKIADIVSSLN